MSKTEQKKAPMLFKVDMTQLKEYIVSKQAVFDKHLEEQRKRERQTMEKGMVYWINT
jgi:hypothetical protein